MTLKIVSPAQAQSMIAGGARLIDVRERGEFARGHIKGATNLPVSEIDRTLVAGDGPVVFHCLSGQRTQLHAHRLSVAAGPGACVIGGGLNAWLAAGLPIAS